MNIPPLLIMGGTLIMTFAYQLALLYHHCLDGSNRTVTRRVVLLHLVMEAVVLMSTLVIVTQSVDWLVLNGLNGLEQS